MMKKIRSYDALAAHLCPDDPAEGARQIDTAILTLQRARYRPRNFNRGIFWIAMLLLSLGLSILGASFVCWLVPSMEPTFYGALAGAVPLLAAKIMVIWGVGSFLYYCANDTTLDYGPLPLPPAAIHLWLVAHGKSDLRYWPEMYWPYVKILAHRRDVLGFVFWRKNPRPVDQYPPVPVLFEERAAASDPHWTYLRSAEGRADSAAYEIDFEQRLEAWERLMFRASLAVLAILFVAMWLPIYPATQNGHLMHAGVLLAFIVMGILLFFGGGTIKMRWLPAAFRRYWFRDLPPEAEQFRDHMLAITD